MSHKIPQMLISATTILGDPTARWRAIGWALPGGRHCGWATCFPIGPSSKRFNSHIVWLPSLSPQTYYYFCIYYLLTLNTTSNTVSWWRQHTKWHHMTKACESFCGHGTVSHLFSIVSFLSLSHRLLRRPFCRVFASPRHFFFPTIYFLQTCSCLLLSPTLLASSSQPDIAAYNRSQVV
jgi:hypothetical protein